MNHPAHSRRVGDFNRVIDAPEAEALDHKPLLVVEADRALHQRHGEALGGGALGFLKHSGPTAVAVLVVLLVFSLVSFGIILNKWTTLARASRESKRFLDVFRKSQKS